MDLHEIYGQYEKNFNNNILPYIKCNKCSYKFYYPRDMCPECGSNNLSIEKSNGNGKIYSYTISSKTIWSIIEMDEGFKLYANITNSGTVDINKKITIVFINRNNRILPYGEIQN